MKTKRIFSLFFSLILSLCLFTPAFATGDEPQLPADPDILAKAALLVDYNTGAIAYGNGITIRQLKELNALKSDRITVGQKLKIPASKAVAAPVRKSAPAAKKTESVAAAPAKTETAPAAEKTEPAQAPAAAEPAPAADTAAPAVEESAPAAADAESSDVKTDPTAEKTYVVQEGDDMTGVSIRWGVSAAAIRELNNLGDNDQLKPGQIIKLPAEAQQ